ncbi:hypothetical protein [Roseateles sp.]|uniref:hypothetical protein n=1 Tax=Roseateles sp. TaxID=1971397 RepID=UPI0025CE133D|nr:hypothetical protein [Roseateles sp.]MBV8037387.1 hypothetical protein [Roseateles sp.]
MRIALTPHRAALLALAASLFAHAALLGGERVREEAARPARAVSVALLQPPVLPVAQPDPTPPALPRHAARGDRPAERPTAPVEAPIAAPQAPLLRLAGPAAWRYRLRQGGQDGEAQLDWRPEADGRYSLRLTRRVGEHALPALESLGRTGSAGLAPERFALQRGGQDRQTINFDSEGRRVSFSAIPAQLDLPEGAQDRLSWWLQLAALVQASNAQAGTPGGRWRVWVAGLRGELREWVFETMEARPEDAGMLHLRRQPLGPRDPGVELWLDPARGHWPVRLRQGDPETRGFEISLSDVNS